MKKFAGGLFQDIAMTVSGRQIDTNRLGGTGSTSIPPAVFESESLIPDGRKIRDF